MKTRSLGLVQLRLKKIVFALMLLAGVSAPAYGGGVLVIKSDDSAPVRKVLEGFRDTIRHRVVVVHNNIGEDTGDSGRMRTGAQETIAADLVFAIGSPALEAALAKNNDLPIVYSMVPDPSKVIGKDTDNITGVNMTVPVTDVVNVLTSLQPPVRRLGVVTSSLSREHRFAKAARSAQARGVQLLTATAESPQEISRALRSLAGKIDALWIVPDSVILRSAVMEYLLLWSYENKVPVVGLSEEHTRKGALLSLSPGSGKEIGRQAGELAMRILRGEKVSNLPPVTITQAQLTANLKAAGKLGIEISDRVLATAENAVRAPVYREGDWWVFRVTEQGMATRQFRVTYIRGRFESNDPIYAEMPPYLQVVHSRSYDRQDLDFPLLPGKKWSFESDIRGFDTGKLRKAINRIEAIGWSDETVATDAGEFEAFELRHERDSVGDGEATFFYSPRTKSIVKSSSDFQSHAGDLKVEMELIAYGTAEITSSPHVAELPQTAMPASDSSSMIDWSRVQAPVYEEGDWWIFEVTRDAKGPREYRVTYRDGSFQSNHPDFLRVSEYPNSISWLPLISVNLEGPKKRWFDFPLIPEKEWSFKYRHTTGNVTHNEYGQGEHKTWRNVHAKVIGTSSEPIETRAGTFKATKITRSVFSPPVSTHELVYFYSPETKSIIKLRSKSYFRDISDTSSSYEIELVAYGSGVGDELFVNRRLEIPSVPPIDGGTNAFKKIEQARIPPSRVQAQSDLSRLEAPVYEEGDWWVFRVKRDEGPVEQYRVSYTNGRFKSNHPEFLKVSRDPASISFLPLISVNLQGTNKRWFEFPLTRGRSWRFRYLHTSGHPGASGIGGAGFRALRSVTGLVVGPAAHLVHTLAGDFVTVELRRVVETSWGWFEFTYFYSPETNSTVKVVATGFAENNTGRTEFGYEMELVAYGHASSARPVSLTNVSPPRQLPQRSRTAHDWSKVEAPVYKEGDWWLFRVSHGGRSERYRVIYRDGSFESDDRLFLRGSFNSFSLTWLPLVSVHLNDPERRWFDFPLVGGKEWKFTYRAGRSHDRLGDRSAEFEWNTIRKSEARVASEIPQYVETPAGKFETILIERKDSWVTDVEFRYFYSPETRSVVKLSARLIDNKYIPEPYELELIDYGRSAYPRQHTGSVEAPVYREGDWWVFRASIDGVSEQHRIEYRNGRFESDDQGFLRGEDMSGAPSMQAWATVHLNDPQRKWFDFPLRKGKTWSFQYPIFHFFGRAENTGNARARAIGPTSRELETEAGRFVAFEIQRIDIVDSWAKLTYFYSPETKSVIKLIGKKMPGTSGALRTVFELELLSYGRDGVGSADLVKMPKKK